MKRERKLDTTSKKDVPKRIRVCYIVPEDVDRNIEAYSQRERLMKSQVITEALQEYLSNRSLHPNKTPKLSISY
jgi:hypothetical protein